LVASRRVAVHGILAATQARSLRASPISAKAQGQTHPLGAEVMDGRDWFDAGVIGAPIARMCFPGMGR